MENEKLVYTVDELSKLLSISRNSAYEAVKKGIIPSLKCGRRILIPIAALQRKLAEVDK